MDKKNKNVVLIVVDQLRYDCIGINGNEIISTPNLDRLATEGFNFENMYCATPSCIPARASLLTGLKQKNHGRVGYEDNVEWNYETMIGKVFSENGYYTKCIGKMHVYPPRKMCGFHHIELHDGYLHENRKYNGKYRLQFSQVDDYLDWLKEKKGENLDIFDLGLDCNSWVSRTWSYEEEYHPTNWVVTRALKFLKKRDTTLPFFLKLSFVRPHSPLDPPQYYYDMYMRELENIPLPKIGNWEEKMGFSNKTFSTIAKKGIISEKELKRAIASYYALITHIDHQIGRFLIGLEEHDLIDNTVILFVSDHGDQMGNHNLLRKGYPYQESVHIPLIIYDKDYENKEKYPNRIINELVELRDILPTLLELGNGNKINNIDGKSVVPLLKNEGILHEYIHGEHELGEYSSQFIITKEWKYIWYSQSGEEQLFNLIKDPIENKNLIGIKKYEKILNELREKLIKELENREESYVKNKKLQKGKKAKTTLEFLKKK